MFHCHVCGATESSKKLVREVFDIDGRPVLVEDIPAIICAHWGEPVFNLETTEWVRRMVRGEAQPFRSVTMEVFAFR